MKLPPEIDDLIVVKGEVRFVLTGPDGEVKQDFTIDNLVPTVGKGLIADRMKNVPAIAAISHMGIGTGAAAPGAGDTQLSAELWRKALVSLTVAGAVVTHTATYLPGEGTGALVEAGLFNAAAAGTLLARTTYAVINKAAGDTLNVTWTVTVG